MRYLKRCDRFRNSYSLVVAIFRPHLLFGALLIDGWSRSFEISGWWREPVAPQRALWSVPLATGGCETFSIGDFHEFVATLWQQRALVQEGSARAERRRLRHWPSASPAHLDVAVGVLLSKMSRKSAVTWMSAG